MNQGALIILGENFSRLSWVVGLNFDYLEPIRDSLQKPIGGLSLLAVFPAKSMQKKVYG